MSAAEYYNVGPDYFQQNSAATHQQPYPQQPYPQHPQPVRLAAFHMELRFRPSQGSSESLSRMLMSSVLPPTTTAATATLLPPTTAHASGPAPASVPNSGGRPGPAAAQSRQQELPHSVSGCDMLLLRDRRGVRVLVSFFTSPFLFPWMG